MKETAPVKGNLISFIYARGQSCKTDTFLVSNASTNDAHSFIITIAKAEVEKMTGTHHFYAANQGQLESVDQKIDCWHIFSLNKTAILSKGTLVPENECFRFTFRKCFSIPTKLKASGGDIKRKVCFLRVITEGKVLKSFSVCGRDRIFFGQHHDLRQFLQKQDLTQLEQSVLLSSSEFTLPQSLQRLNPLDNKKHWNDVRLDASVQLQLVHVRPLTPSETAHCQRVHLPLSNTKIFAQELRRTDFFDDLKDYRIVAGAISNEPFVRDQNIFLLALTNDPSVVIDDAKLFTFSTVGITTKILYPLDPHKWKELKMPSTATMLFRVTLRQENGCEKVIRFLKEKIAKKISKNTEHVPNTDAVVVPHEDASFLRLLLDPTITPAEIMNRKRALSIPEQPSAKRLRSIVFDTNNHERYYTDFAVQHGEWNDNDETAYRLAIASPTDEFFI